MAECHPVAFQWVMEAKARGATVVHVDPRFTRTSAVSDVYVPIRAGADIAFVGGLINYVLQNKKYFHDYVVTYTNAATILTEDFADTEDLDGVFSGLNTEQRYYDFDTWQKVEPPTGTVYNYPPRGDEQPSITGYPARPDIATQIYNQSVHTIMVAKVCQGNEPIDKVVRWAEGELEGLLRT